MHIRWLIPISLIATLTATLTGCSAVTTALEAINVFENIKFKKTTKLRTLSVSANMMANQDMATAVDLLFVRDKDLVKKLPTDGLVWFQQRQRWLDNNPGVLTLVSIEIPPEKKIKEVTLPEDWEDSSHVVAYLKYFSKGGQNRLNLTSFKHAYIELGSKDVKFGEVK